MKANDYITRHDAIRALQMNFGDYGGARRAICKLPAADVAPVVRCRNCANFRQNAHGVCYCNEYGGAITPEDYCSRAVRENEPPAK